MTNDDRLNRILRAALPSAEGVMPSRDLWPAILRRGEVRRRFTLTDLSIAAVVVIVLLIFPEWFWLLAYQL